MGAGGGGAVHKRAPSKTNRDDGKVSDHCSDKLMKKGDDHPDGKPHCKYRSGSYLTLRIHAKELLYNKGTFGLRRSIFA